jgi:hypothetical protein
MELVSIAISQSIRFVKAMQPPPASEMIYIRDAVRGIEERYGFLQAPRMVEDYDLKKGVTFLSGRYNREISIDRFIVYEGGVLCESKFPTETCDEFLDDVFKWAKESMGIAVERLELTGRLYLSNVEIRSEAKIDSKFARFAALGRQIAESLRSYGQQPSEFSVSQFSLHCDVSNMEVPRTTAFSFDRRAGHPYSSGLYFSSAPLQTKDHLIVLRELENILLNS